MDYDPFLNAQEDNYGYHSYSDSEFSFSDQIETRRRAYTLPNFPPPQQQQQQHQQQYPHTQHQQAPQTTPAPTVTSTQTAHNPEPASSYEEHSSSFSDTSSFSFSDVARTRERSNTCPDTSFLHDSMQVDLLNGYNINKNGLVYDSPGRMFREERRRFTYDDGIHHYGDMGRSSFLHEHGNHLNGFVPRLPQAINGYSIAPENRVNEYGGRSVSDIVGTRPNGFVGHNELLYNSQSTADHMFPRDSHQAYGALPSQYGGFVPYGYYPEFAGTDLSGDKKRFPTSQNDKPPPGFKLPPGSRAPILDSVIACAYNNWGSKILVHETNPLRIVIRILNFELFYRSTVQICAKENPTENKEARIKAMRRYFDNFPMKRERGKLNHFDIEVKPRFLKKVNQSLQYFSENE